MGEGGQECWGWALNCKLPDNLGRQMSWVSLLWEEGAELGCRAEHQLP